jgi:hypothetical protein
MHTQRANMLAETFESDHLALRQRSPQQLAYTLLFNAPARGWDNYIGLDDALRIGIDIAEDQFTQHGAQELTKQYGSANIITDMHNLRVALRLLAKEGAAMLSGADRDALTIGTLTLGSMIRQTLMVAEANRPGRRAKAPELDNGHEYWEMRVQRLVANCVSQLDSRNDYSRSKQFSHYLVDAQKLLSAICHDLGLQEVPAYAAFQ